MKIYLTCLFLFFAGVAPLRSGSISVPNASFESPATTFVTYGAIDVWQKTPKPAWYDDEGEAFQWNQLTGIFKNPEPTASSYIHNCAANQALWLFVVPEAGLFLDFFSTNAFDVKFEPGKSYTLTVGVIGGGGGMRTGATLQAILYYRDAASNAVTVAATTIAHSLATFPDKTNFVDQAVATPIVRAPDAWAGKNIGLKFLSTVTTNLQGGYWDLDNVRLTSVQEPALTGTISTDNKFILELQSEPGVAVEVQSTTNLFLSNWASAHRLTNFTGTTNLAVAATNTSQIFYRARRLP